MKKQKTFFRLLSGSLFLLLAILIITKPEICKNSATNGILLCGRVIIPSLFVFTVSLLFILKCGIADFLSKIDPLTKKLFGLSSKLTLISFFSFIGGYPVGAKLLNEAVKDGEISPTSAGKMLNFCIGAGPSFIVGAVGNAILGNKNIGYVLLASHLSACVILTFVFRGKVEYCTISRKKKFFCFSDSFVDSVTESSVATLGICGYVIFFSVITAYTEYLTRHTKHLKDITMFLEVTNAVEKTDNIFIISFLLGFAGLSVWCQIISTAKEIKINIPSLISCRIFHGLLSCGITAILLNFFPVTVSCISNGTDFSSKASYSTPALSVALVIMGMFFIISVFNNCKKHTGKFIEDVI